MKVIKLYTPDGKEIAALDVADNIQITDLNIQVTSGVSGRNTTIVAMQWIEIPVQS